jgi:ribosomal protein S18 acetylase RimI-like enzyme
MNIIVKQPESPEELRQYFDLRWRILRAPWGQAQGSEKDDIEDHCFHLIAKHNNQTVGVGRLSYNSATEAQIRYMAVAEDYERRGIGRMVVRYLEQQAINSGISTIVLHAREPAVGFYQRLGYHLEEKSYVLFDEIQHYRMTKSLMA